MSDYEIRNAKEWDAASSVRLSSRLSEDLDDGFTTVQASKAKRQNLAQPAQSAKNPAGPTAHSQNDFLANLPAVAGGHTNPRAIANRGRGGPVARGSGANHHNRGGLISHNAPKKASSQRNQPRSAAEHMRLRGDPATDVFSFSTSRNFCHNHLKTQGKGLKVELSGIGRRTDVHIAESPEDAHSVLIWGDEAQVRRARLQLEDLNKKIKSNKWAKNPAFDGRRDHRRELRAHEEEQASRLQLYADSQEYPFEYSFIWPKSELTLQSVVDAHDKLGGAIASLRVRYQCSIRCDVTNSTIIVQGMQEQDVVEASRTFEGIARQMVADMADHMKISLVSAPSVVLHEPFVSMDQEVDLKVSLYQLPGSDRGRRDTFAVRTPKLWTRQSEGDEVIKARSEKIRRRLDRFNRRTILGSLERRLTNMYFVKNQVRMHVDFGELAFLTYSLPAGKFKHHSFESFRQTMAKDRTNLLLQAMRPCVPMSDVMDCLLQHPAFKQENEPRASPEEAYVVVFDFCRPDGNGIYRYEQEFQESPKKDEMEVRRKSWVKMGDDSDNNSPMILSMLDWEKLDWQLKIDAYDSLGPPTPKEYADFESGVGVSHSQPLACIKGPPTQRANWPRGYRDLVRVSNKPTVRFRLERTDHILEMAREDIYEIDSLQSCTPTPESKWTASFYYTQWGNKLSELPYLGPGDKMSWEQSLSTFFPEEEATTEDFAKKPQGPVKFLKEVEDIKNILWEVTKPRTGKAVAAPTSSRIGEVENENPAAKNAAI